MATKLVMRFGTMYGEKNFSYNYAKPTLDSSTVNTVMDTMITNGSIFKYPPLTKVSAKLVTTTETEIAVD